MPRLVSLRSTLTAVVLGAAIVASLPSTDACANGAQRAEVGPSGLPLPRFVSLKAGRVNMRVGPGLNYAVEWLYLKEGLPVEIIHEYGNWRQVRDAQGAEGWINQALLSGRRTGLAAPWFRGKKAYIPLLSEPSSGASVVAQIQPGALGKIRSCNGEWCRMEFSGHTGWMDQTMIWGAYAGEKIGD
jgi:SH3-like domain-containing protein